MISAKTSRRSSDLLISKGLVEFRNAANTLVGTDDYTYDAQLRKTASTGRNSVSQAWVYNDLGQLATDTTTCSGQSYAVN